MSETKLYTITNEQAEIIREALSTCDGEWWISVRWGENWELGRRTKSKEFDTLFGSDGAHVEEGIEGVEIALCFAPETTMLGDVHKALKCSEIRGIRIEGNYRNETKITDLTSLQDCELLEKFTLSFCRSLVDISPLSSLQSLHTLYLSGGFGEGSSLVDISPLSSLQSLHTITLSSCRSLVDISPLSSLHNLHTLKLKLCSSLVDISPLLSLHNLHTLDLSQCSSLVDISPLSSLQSLHTLYLSRCSSLVDISPLASLKNLKTIDLNSCESLVDISPLSSLQSLHTLYLSEGFGEHSSLIDISPLASLKNLKTLNLSSFSSLDDISPLSSLQSLHTLYLSGDYLKGSSLVDISPLSSLKNLHTISLSSCSSLVDISPLSSLHNLHTLDLSRCNELADNRTWTPLTQLLSVKEIKGSFPSYFTTKIFARNATNNQDWEYIQANLSEWIKTAESSPTEPNLLTQVGRACALHPDGYESLAHIISLSTTNDAPEIDELFATAVPLTSQDIIGVAIQSAVDQSQQPLPPETLIALHNHLPSNTTLRDNTIIALTRSISQDTVPDWGKNTAKALREQLNDSRYPITTSIHDDGFSVLANQQFTPIQSHFFGVLCSGHARSTNIDWRNHFHNLLCGLALSQSDTATRNQALSDISSGLAICGDSAWVQKRLDYLLKAAAEIDPDTSVIYAAVAHAHAIGGRWDEAQETVSGIASPTVRDASLNKLCAMVLASNLPNKMQHAISFVNTLSEPMERAQKLYELGFHDGLLADLVAYGQLVGLLTEFPEKQKEVVAYVTEKKPEIALSDKPAIASLSYEDCTKMLKKAFPTRFQAIIDCMQQHTKQEKQT